MAKMLKDMKEEVKAYRDHLLDERARCSQLHTELKKAMDEVNTPTLDRSILDTIKALRDTLRDCVANLTEDLVNPEIEEWR